MWTLMKKNSFLFVLLSGFLMALFTVYLLAVRKTLSLSILIFLGQMSMYCVLASVLTSEKKEEKNNGYAFMKLLPIKDHTIVASKFVVILTIVAFLYAYNLVLVSFMEAEAPLLAFSWIFLLLCGNLNLILAAGMYLLVYRWGYGIFLKISVLTLIILMVGPFLFMEFVLFRRNIEYSVFLQSINDLSWFIWLSVSAIALLLFWSLMQAAVKAKEQLR